MSEKNRISANVQDVWMKLNARWQGEDANAFHKEYIVKILEIVESMEDACADLRNMSSEFMKELQIIEQTLANQ